MGAIIKLSPHDKVSAQIAHWCYSWLPDSVFASHIAHGGRGFANATKLKVIGTVSGIDDWLVIYGGQAYCIEIKTGLAALSKAQRETNERLRASGAQTAVVHSKDEFVALIRFWEIPIRVEPRADPILPADEVPAW